MKNLLTQTNPRQTRMQSSDWQKFPCFVTSHGSPAGSAGCNQGACSNPHLFPPCQTENTDLSHTETQKTFKLLLEVRMNTQCQRIAEGCSAQLWSIEGINPKKKNLIFFLINNWIFTELLQWKTPLTMILSGFSSGFVPSHTISKEARNKSLILSHQSQGNVAGVLMQLWREQPG